MLTETQFALRQGKGQRGFPPVTGTKAAKIGGLKSLHEDTAKRLALETLGEVPSSFPARYKANAAWGCLDEPANILHCLASLGILHECRVIYDDVPAMQLACRKLMEENLPGFDGPPTAITQVGSGTCVNPGLSFVTPLGRILWTAATPDAQVEHLKSINGSMLLIEAKSNGDKQACAKGPLEEHIRQVRWQMMCLNLPFAYVTVRAGTHQRPPFLIERDMLQEQALLSKCAEWYCAHIIPAVVQRFERETKEKMEKKTVRGELVNAVFDAEPPVAVSTKRNASDKFLFYKMKVRCVAGDFEGKYFTVKLWSGEAPGLEVGDTVDITGRVKLNQEYKGNTFNVIDVDPLSEKYPDNGEDIVSVEGMGF